MKRPLKPGTIAVLSLSFFAVLFGVPTACGVWMRHQDEKRYAAELKAKQERDAAEAARKAKAEAALRDDWRTNRASIIAEVERALSNGRPQIAFALVQEHSKAAAGELDDLAARAKAALQNEVAQREARVRSTTPAKQVAGIDEMVKSRMLSIPWVRDVYPSPGHINVGVIASEKDWSSPMIGQYLCATLRNAGSSIKRVRIVDIEAVVYRGKSPRQAEMSLFSCQ